MRFGNVWVGDLILDYYKMYLGATISIVVSTIVVLIRIVYVGS